MIESSAEQDAIAGQIVDSAFAVHTTLGSGLLESVYEQCLACELTLRGVAIAHQVPVPLIYRDTRADEDFASIWLSAAV
jgi:GxxExxY protein